MTFDLKELVTHDGTEECPACRAQDIVAQTVLPAAAAWESAAELPRFSLAIHGAAGLIGTMMQEGISRKDIEQALAQLLDDLERQMAEDETMGGPPQGSA
jgi:hypothetical protein